MPRKISLCNGNKNDGMVTRRVTEAHQQHHQIVQNLLAAALEGTRENKLAMAVELDHMYIGCSDSKASLEKDIEVQHLKGLLLVHLDLIQQQNDQLQAKDKQIKMLKDENENLRAKLERMDRRVSLSLQKRPSEAATNTEHERDTAAATAAEVLLKPPPQFQDHQTQTLPLPILDTAVNNNLLPETFKISLSPTSPLMTALTVKTFSPTPPTTRLGSPSRGSALCSKPLSPASKSISPCSKMGSPNSKLGSPTSKPGSPSYIIESPNTRSGGDLSWHLFLPGSPTEAVDVGIGTEPLLSKYSPPCKPGSPNSRAASTKPMSPSSRTGSPPYKGSCSPSSKVGSPPSKPSSPANKVSSPPGKVRSPPGKPVSPSQKLGSPFCKTGSSGATPSKSSTAKPESPKKLSPKTVVSPKVSPRERHRRGGEAGESPQERHPRGGEAGESPRERHPRGGEAGESPREKHPRGVEAGESPQERHTRGSEAGESPRERLTRGSESGESPRERHPRGSEAGESPRERHPRGSEAGESPRERLTRGSEAGDSPRERYSRGGEAMAIEATPLSENESFSEATTLDMAKKEAAVRCLDKGERPATLKRKSESEGEGTVKKAKVDDGTNSDSTGPTDHNLRSRDRTKERGKEIVIKRGSPVPTVADRPCTPTSRAAALEAKKLRQKLLLKGQPPSVRAVRGEGILNTSLAYYLPYGVLLKDPNPEEECCQSTVEDPIPEEECSNLSHVEIPRWGTRMLTSLYVMEGTENLEDEVFLKRHAKPEQDEKRRKRWDLQRMREQRHYERLRERYESRQSVSEPEGSGYNRSLWPTPESALYLLVDDCIPVCAFGQPMARIPPQEFMLPWLSSRGQEGISTRRRKRP